MEISSPELRFSRMSRRAAIALRNVSGMRFGESSASPKLTLAPAKLTDGRMVSLSIKPSLVRNSLTSRSHKPDDAVSSRTSQPRSRALSPKTVSITVLPVPRAPVINMILPGAPTPLSRPFSKSRITRLRPINSGGSPPAVGLNGFIRLVFTRFINAPFSISHTI